jgi:hypothetical protein
LVQSEKIEDNWFERESPSISLEKESLKGMCEQLDVESSLYEELLDIEHSYTLKSSRSGIIKAMLAVIESYEKGEL